MKKINFILIIYILFTCLNFKICYSHEAQVNALSFSHALQVTTNFIKKHAFFIATLPVLYSHHHDLKAFIQERPLLSSITFYFLIHYSCDTILKYKEQQEMLDIIENLKKMSLLLTIAHGVKNHIQQKPLALSSSFADQEFFDRITKDISYSFQELTLLTLKAYQEVKTCLQVINNELNIQSEEFVFLCHASCTDIATLFYLAQNDNQLYKMLYQFNNSPEKELESITDYIHLHITQTFSTLEQYFLNFTPCQSFTHEK